MFNSSIIARRLLRSRQQAVILRQFSSSVLLVPLKQQETMPYEMRSNDLSEAEFNQVQVEFKEFNQRCSEELKEMNQNRITNIIERCGVEGWETAADLAHLQKSFNFASI